MPAAKKKTLGFKTEIAQLLNLLANAVYSNEEVALRELISNASDALDKLRFMSLSHPDYMEDGEELQIKVLTDKDKHQLIVSDNGIGMNDKELIDNLGTIAKSGTKEFMQQLSEADKKEKSQLIGQFGIGFYSAFVIADKVTVQTRRAGDAADKAWCWESDGTGEFTLEPVTKEHRGTTITLHLKDDKREFLEDMRLRDIITRYANHIGAPILMRKPPAPKAEPSEDAKDDAVVEAEVIEEEIVNQAVALWTKPKSEVKDEQYHEFYKHIAHDFQDPLSWVHNKVEGKHQYTTLLYIPQRAPFDLWNRERPRGLKLYVQRVFIMDDAEQFMPLYLRFVKGIVDTADLPLNVSREILQTNHVIDVIRSGCVKRVLDTLEKMAKDDTDKYATFWKEFGSVMKEGPGEDFANKERIAKLLRFASTEDADATEQTVSLEDYVSRMKKDQQKIYYIVADSHAAAKSSPHLEVFKERGIEVLLLSDRVDEWLVSHLTEFDGKPLQSVARGDLDLPEEETSEEEKKEKQQEQEKAEKDFEDVLSRVNKVLQNVKEVRLTHRLTDSPSCIVADENEISANLKRMLKEAGQAVPETQPILELNPKHALVEQLRDTQDEDRFANLSQVLLDLAVLSEGGQVDNPRTLVHSLLKLL